jgi:hypothetical protein
MIAEVQKYRGVSCVSCRQPISLPSKAAQRETDFRKREQESNEDPIVSMFTLRCNACDRETLYMPWDVIDFEGLPKVRSRRLKMSYRIRGAD